MKRVSVPGTMLLATVLSAGALAAHDSWVPVRRQFVTRGAVYAIERYRHHVSPHLRGRVQCRFHPTCSAYGLESVKKYGGVRGGWRAVGRIARCNPATPMGTFDPP
jgi:putative membrane protein insertion efficiency factor